MEKECLSRNGINERAVRGVGFATAFSSLLILCGCVGLAADKNAPKPTVIFSASTNTIAAQQSVTLNWQATHSNSVTITAAAGSATRTVVTSTQASGGQTDSPAQTTT